MDAFKEGWFTETGVLQCGHVQSMAVEKVLFHEKSKYHDILVFKSPKLGHVFVIDNIVQYVERDEYAYPEMISFLPLNCHPDPKKVLIVGGGDGSVLQEVVKHPMVESVTICEIDEKVIEVSKKFLPFLTQGFSNPKSILHIEDGVEFVKSHQGEFDVIITDSPGPVGPETSLFQKPYYESLKLALREGGIICSQGESIWQDIGLIREMVTMCKTLFPVVRYATSYVGTYSAGQIGYLLCSTLPQTNFKEPLLQYTMDILDDLKLKYYSRDIHRASLALPLFVSKEIGLYEAE